MADSGLPGDTAPPRFVAPAGEPAAQRHVYLIDGSGFIFRAFYAIPPMNRPDGTPVNAVRGFCDMIMKLMDGTDADHIACVFDYSSKSFRNEIYDRYKAHRPEAPEELVPQFPLIREAARAFNLPVVEMEGFEADDIIATYARMAREAGAEVTVVSSDKDLMQLVGDGVVMFDGVKNRTIREREVVEKFGVKPDKVVDVQALAGDSVDNVPGVPGIGLKTAASLIAEYGDLETVLARAPEIRQPKRRERLIEHAEDARVSLRLVTLDRHVPLAQGLDALARREPDSGILLDFLRAQDFRTLTKRAQAWLERRQGRRPPPSRADRRRAMSWSRTGTSSGARCARRANAAWSPSTPRPRVWMLSRPNWSASRCRPRPEAVATSRSLTARWTRCWRRRGRLRSKTPAKPLRPCSSTRPCSRSATTSSTTSWFSSAPACPCRLSTTRCCCPTAWRAAGTTRGWTRLPASSWTGRRCPTRTLRAAASRR